MKQSSTLLGVVVAALVCLVAPTSQLEAAVDREIYRELASQAPDLDLEVLEAALSATGCAERSLQVERRILSIIDYSLPSTARRLWIFDLDERQLLFHELVAHGVNTGENRAARFSNIEGSRQSSLGLFLTDHTYVGRNGYSLKLQGLEKGFNHNAWDRTIVLHGAWYVSEAFRREHGRLGRSWGCPAVRTEVARELIDTIKEGSLLFIYYPDAEWLRSSYYLNACSPSPVAGP